jgi:hypothetical protein
MAIDFVAVENAFKQWDAIQNGGHEERTGDRCWSAEPGPAPYAAKRSTDVGEPHSQP